GTPRLEQPPHLATGHRTPDRRRRRSRYPGLGSVAWARSLAPVQEGYVSHVQVARMAELRNGCPGRHGLSYRQYALPGLETGLYKPDRGREHRHEQGDL